MDVETDRLIQEMLRTQLFANTTVITIAHRLATIMVRPHPRVHAYLSRTSLLALPDPGPWLSRCSQDYDRIAVVNNGVIVEQGHPAHLLANPAGHLTALVAETGESMSAHLRDVANAALLARPQPSGAATAAM